MVAGCGLLTAERTFEPGIEHLTSGSFHFVAEPPVAAEPLSVRLRMEDGTSSARSFDFAVGDVVTDSPTDVPGRRGVVVNGRSCAGEFIVEAGRTTEVTIRLVGDTCTVVQTGVHEEAHAASDGALTLG
jgi:hypothetical protein